MRGEISVREHLLSGPGKYILQEFYLFVSASRYMIVDGTHRGYTAIFINFLFVIMAMPYVIQWQFHTIKCRRLWYWPYIKQRKQADVIRLKLM